MSYELSEDEAESGAEDVEDVDEMHMYPEPEGRGFVDRIEL